MRGLVPLQSGRMQERRISAGLEVLSGKQEVAETEGDDAGHVSDSNLLNLCQQS